jgi:hypothetical protein
MFLHFVTIKTVTKRFKPRLIKRVKASQELAVFTIQDHSHVQKLFALHARHYTDHRVFK